MLDRDTVRKLLGPFDASLPDDRIARLLQYLGLLLRWNQKINLTAIRQPEECVTRHFGESFLLSNLVPLNGRLLDIGSGAGFPGMALKLIRPELGIVLLEPAAKKRSFLKEVARTCGMEQVRVVGSRAREFAEAEPAQLFDLVTIRAVGGLESVIPAATRLLKPRGFLCLWLGGQQVGKVRSSNPRFRWKDPISIPLSNERYILAGKLREP